MALRQREVVAPHLGGGLQLAVDPPVALLDAAGVPRKIEVEEVGAVRLEVEAFAGRVRGEQDAQRILRRTFLEAPLDLLAAGSAGQPVDHLDALVGARRALDRALQGLPQESLGALAVLGEDEDAAVVPLGRLAHNRLAELRKVRAQVVADPVDQPARLGVGPGAGLFGHLSHVVQQPELLPPGLLRRGVAPESGFGLAVGGLDQVFLLGLFGGLGFGGEIAVAVGFQVRARVVRAGEPDAGRFVGLRGRVDFLDQPVPGADADHLADERVAVGEVGVGRGRGSGHGCVT